MRVITGTARGRRLATPAGLETRPTAARVKEAVMSTIQFEIEGARVLDLFAGSGQMGIEALSRGAASCVFVDSAPASLEVVRENLKTTGLADKAKLSGRDVLAYLTSGAVSGPFDIVFLDPPYAAGLLPKVLQALAPLVSESGVVLCESNVQELFPQAVGSLALHREYRYGKTKITAYRQSRED